MHLCSLLQKQMHDLGYTCTFIQKLFEERKINGEQEKRQGTIKVNHYLIIHQLIDI
jgi:hypothetical protein